ncbi:MAG: hypothetical protein Q9190_005230, partial [Brigantiaea leucoxantha]
MAYYQYGYGAFPSLHAQQQKYYLDPPPFYDRHYDYPVYECERIPSLRQRAQYKDRGRHPARHVTQALRAPAEKDVRAHGKRYRYRWVRKIGEGGFGVCDLYQKIPYSLDPRDRERGAQSRSGAELIVYKQVKGEIEMYRNSRIPLEVHILKNLLGNNHDRIVYLDNWGQDYDVTAFHFEFCSAGDMHNLIDNYQQRDLDVPEDFVWHSFIQMAEALAYIHSAYVRDRKREAEPPAAWKPVIHRDIKPGNIFLRWPGRSSRTYPDLVLGDFGLATTDPGRDNGCLVGTRAYQPPEIPFHSRAGDVWSMGAVIHEMTFGGPPIAAMPRGYRFGKEAWQKDGRARA